ncbi:hypothetical protein BLJAPNOD_01523 [Ensifer sp. M14]|jgi:2-keto-4-pentenoate hydratase/2-oxohepta-3-ene-1,7-dioic acid hydratase in catechol pathway|nr:hypothetical protein BLJAPNOD_01523 [Ensifer sp. M14]
MTLAKFASFSAAGGQGYGLVTDQGIIDLSRRHSAKWPTLREVIADGTLTRLADEAASLAPDLSLADIRFEIPVPAPEKIVCVGVNFPDRNEEYRDGQAAPANPRAPSRVMNSR